MWEKFRFSEAPNCSCEHVQTVVNAKGLQLQGDLVNSSDQIRPVTASKRPLLVRFDWYSRKQTPVHMG